MDLTAFVNTLDQLMAVLKVTMPTALWMIGGLWLINIVNWVFFNSYLNILGIYPRHPFGIIGVFFSPIFHGDATHLFYNSIPLFILSSLLLSLGFPAFGEITLRIVVMSGLLIWLVGRKRLHIGASALAMGYWGYLLVNAVYHPSFLAILLAILTLYYLSNLFLNIFPQGVGISWEGHLCGLIAGVGAVFLH